MATMTIVELKAALGAAYARRREAQVRLAALDRRTEGMGSYTNFEAAYGEALFQETTSETTLQYYLGQARAFAEDTTLPQE